jgi:hypothetical protein
VGGYDAASPIGALTTGLHDQPSADAIARSVSQHGAMSAEVVAHPAVGAQDRRRRLTLAVITTAQWPEPASSSPFSAARASIDPKCLAVDPADPDVVYAGLRPTIARSC